MKPRTRGLSYYYNADQLISAVQSGGGSASNAYAYDPAGNRLAETTSSGTTGGQYNNLNQLTGYGSTTTQTVAGHTNNNIAISSATVDAVPATISNGTNFTAYVSLPGGSNVVSVVAQPTSSSGSITTQRYGITVSGETPASLTYDANGNCTQDESGNQYTWDALNRLTAINYTTPTSTTSLTQHLTGTVIGTSGSWDNDGNTRDKAFDGNTSTFFDAPGPDGDWAGLDLGGDGVVDQIKYTSRSGFGSRMVGGVFQASSTADFSSGVVNLYTISSTPSDGVTYTVSVSMTSGLRYVRYLGPSGSYGNVSEVEFDGSIISHSLFAYDGLSRRVQIVETDNATTPNVIFTKNYLWVGQEIAEERDASNNVTKRFFPQGEQQSGTNYYYTRDHLASVREMLNSSGTIVARYSYDPYGRATLVSGTNLATKQYAGYYAHQASGLNLTWSRPYDSNTGRWLSRDTLIGAERSQGPNLYDYVQDNPITHIDPLGQKVYMCCAPIQDTKTFMARLSNACGFRHCWIKTDTMEAGMGPSPPSHNLPSNPLGTPTEINDETGDSKTSKGVQCTEVPDADEACVNRALQIGQKTGNWEPWNNCNTLANSILSKCSKCKQKAAQSDPTMPPPEIL